MMNKNELHKLLMPYHDGELSPEAHAEFEVALRDDPALQAEYEQLAGLSALSRIAFTEGTPEPDLSGLYDAVMSEIRTHEAPQGSPFLGGLLGWFKGLLTFERPIALAGLSAAVAAAVVGFVMIPSADEGPAISPAPGRAELANRRRGVEAEVQAASRNDVTVEHLEASKGKAFVTHDADDPEAPMVLWHVIDDEDQPQPRGL